MVKPQESVLKTGNKLVLIIIIIALLFGAESAAAAGKLSDAAFGDLTKSKLGQHTLKSADATTELLAKQSKLVEKWGAKKADDVISKCFLGICYGDRIDDLNKILKAMPDSLADGFDADRAVKLLGDKKLVDAAVDITKGVDKTAISQVVSDVTEYEKLLEYAKAVKKVDPTIVNPLGDIGQHQLLKVYKSSLVSTKVGGNTIDRMAILKKGYHDSAADKGFGWEHIKAGNHDVQIQQALGLSDADKAVKDVIAEVIETGEITKNIPGGQIWIEKLVVKGEEQNKIRVVVSDVPGSVGSIQTAHPI